MSQPTQTQPINSVDRAQNAVNSAQTGMLYVAEGMSPAWMLNIELALQEIFNNSKNGILTEALKNVNQYANMTSPTQTSNNQLSAAVQEYSNLQNWLSTEMQGVNMMVKPRETISSSIQANYQTAIQQLWQAVEPMLQVAIQNAGQQF